MVMVILLLKFTGDLHTDPDTTQVSGSFPSPCTFLNRTFNSMVFKSYEILAMKYEKLLPFAWFWDHKINNANEVSLSLAVSNLN